MDRCGDCGSVLYFDTVRTAFTYGAGEEAAQLSVDSVMAIQTEDLGQADADGFILKGRAKEADLKGCSLAAETFFQKA